MRTNRTGRLRALCLVVLSTLVLTAGLAVPASAADPEPPAGVPAGSGQLAGTERVDDWNWSTTGAVCIQATKSIFALAGIGTYHGRTAGGQEVVYRTQLDSPSQTLYGDGAIKVEVENPQTYYHGPYGTHGTSDSSCTPATVGSPIPAEFRVFAADHVYRVGEGGAQVPCRGQGTFTRGNKDFETAKWYAEWTLNDDCTVVGNAAGAPGSGVASSGTAHTHSGIHRPCGDGNCVDNFEVDYKQYLPFKGLYVAMGGPSSASIGSSVAVTAAVTNDGQPVPNAPVTFSVAGPAPAQPPGGAAVTDATGRTSFTFTAAAAGDYTVSASVTNLGTTANGTRVVRFAPPPPPTMNVVGPAKGQTEENVTVTATFSNAGNPVPAATVAFAVAGPGPGSPASGSALTDADGNASFTFTADRAGDYTVTASGSVATQNASGSHAVNLDINTFGREGAITLPSAEHQLRSALVDPAGRFAYFGTFGGYVVKIDLGTFQRVGALALSSRATSGVMDPGGRFAYFGGGGLAAGGAAVIKVDLATFQEVGVIPFELTRTFTSAVIDPAGRYAYFGTDALSPPASVVKVDLATFEPVGTVTLENETRLLAAVIDPSGQYAYFGAGRPDASTGAVVKIDLGTMQRVDTLLLNGAAEQTLTSAVIDADSSYAYFGTSRLSETSNRVVKVDLRSFTRTGALVLEATELGLASAVIDPTGRYAYFGTNPSSQPFPSRVVKVDLATFERAYAIALPYGGNSLADGENHLTSAVIDPQGAYAYFGTDRYNSTTPDLYPPKVIKMAVSRPPVPWLVAGNDAYSTPHASPLSVAAPGVLANDDDTQDDDPLTASLAKGPAHGDVTLNPNGSFTYSPDSGFSGTDTFTYSFDDGMNVSAPATVSITVGAAPQGVQAVNGGAFGFETNVSLFGGPATVKGGSGSTCGQAGQPACADGQSPAVALAPGGGDLTATDPDGNVGQYGPAYIFESHGPLTVRTQGTTGAAGSVTSSASVKDISDNDPFHAHAPDGEVSSTCAASQSVLSGSTRILNGRLVTATDPTSGEPTTEITFPHDWAPAPNTEYRGTLNHVGDSWRIVFNEQILSPEAITVNAVHLYLLGPTAVGDMIIGQSRCGVVTAAANAAPVAGDDAYTATAGRPLVVPAAGVLANDTDADGQALTAAKPPGTRPPASGGGSWTFPGEPAHGTLDLRPDGSFTYTPAPGYSGPDSFTYLAQDSRGKSDPATVSLTVAPAPTRKAAADFDGNGSSDVSVFRPSDGTWYLQGSPQQNYGAPGDIAVPADYDGDGKTDVAVFRPSNGVWYVKGSAGTDTAVAFGASGDIPVPADYDGDGKADLAVFRSGVWYVKGSAGADTAVAFGASGDIPVPADYDGDGKADIAVFRNGVWYVKGSAGVDFAVAFGTAGDIPVPGDYDGDGNADVAVFRPSTGVWFVQGAAATAWGTSGDIPVPGDYDGDGALEIAVFRPSNGVWFVQGGPTTAWGANGDVPLPLPAAVHRSMG